MTTETDIDFFFTHIENQDAIVVVHVQYLINRKTP
jgi:hypothetical protein